MKDLGFGLVDQRSVIVVLITAILCSLLGLVFPLHTENIFRAFLDLVLLTGYLYVSRTLFRLPLAFLVGVRNAIKNYHYPLKRYSPVRGYFRIAGKEVEITRGWIFIASLVDQDNWTGFLAFLDRVGLIAVTVLVTLPTIGRSLMITGGVIGLAFMLVTYLIGGSFSFLVEDALKRAADEHADEQMQLRDAAGNPNVRFPRAIETYTVDHRYDNMGGD